METPKAGWTQTTDVVKWAEDFSIFLSREKTNAERCLHDCERLLNDPNVTDSDSLRDGVRDLMSKTEDNFGTLLHLERVINMKNHGDISQQRTTPSIKIQQPQNSSSKTVAGSAPVQFTQTGRFKQQRIHGGGDFLKRDSKNNDGSTDEHFDDQFKDDFFFDESNHEETPNETLDDFDDDSGFPEAAYKNRPSSGEKVSMLAKSMPMNVPDMRKFGMDHSPPELDEDTQDIPTKINELARSLYVDAIGELPSPRLIE